PFPVSQIGCLNGFGAHRTAGNIEHGVNTALVCDRVIQCRYGVVVGDIRGYRDQCSGKILALLDQGLKVCGPSNGRHYVPAVCDQPLCRGSTNTRCCAGDNCCRLCGSHGLNIRADARKYRDFTGRRRPETAPRYETMVAMAENTTGTDTP